MESYQLSAVGYQAEWGRPPKKAKILGGWG